MENSDSDGVDWAVKVSIQVTSKQEPTSQQVAMLQEISEFTQKNGMRRLCLLLNNLQTQYFLVVQDHPTV